MAGADSLRSVNVPALRPFMLPVVPVVVLLVSGCGPAAGGGSAKTYKGPEQAVAKVVDDLGKTARVGDAKKICGEILAPQLAAKITSAQQKPCDKGLSKLMTAGDDSAFTVDDITLTGDRATASVHVGSGKNRERTTLEFVKTGTRWQIASLGG